MNEKVIRDNVHGDIQFNDSIFIEIMNTPEFQRTRRIMQLGGASLTYPSAIHTRFSHSIGVYHVITMFLKNEYFNNISEYEKRLVLLAGLLHDIGHGPFSHTFEKITKIQHEEYTINLIENCNGYIAKILKKYSIKPEDVTAIIKGKYSNKILNLLVSSQLDADRLDYLKRDSYNCGVDYSMIDITWIIRNVKIKDDKMIFPKKTIYAIESYLLGRYHMFKQVYNHKGSIIFDTLITLWFKRAKELHDNSYKFLDNKIEKFLGFSFNNSKISIDDYLEYDDYLMFDLLKLTLNEKDNILKDLSDRIINRKLFKIIPDTEKNREKIKNKIKEQNFNLKYYYIRTTLKKPIIYTDDNNVSDKDEIIWIEEQNKIKPLSKISLLTDSIKKINNSDNENFLLFPKELV